MTTSWNRGAVHARFGRVAEAGSYQRWAAAALHHDAGLAAQYQVGGCGAGWSSCRSWDGMGKHGFVIVA